MNNTEKSRAKLIENAFRYYWTLHIQLGKRFKWSLMS